MKSRCPAMALAVFVTLSSAVVACGGGGAPAAGTPDASVSDHLPEVQSDVETGPDSQNLDPGWAGDWAFLDGYEPADGAFLAPCATNTDCLSGFCVEGPEGPICTKTCLGAGDCPPDYSCIGIVNTYPDVVFVCLPKFGRVCTPCTQDSQCAGGQCVAFPDGRACTVPCEQDQDCANPYRCREVGNLEERYCLPPSGTCACRPADAGVKRFCEVTNEHGTCFGYETCDPAVGFSGCDARIPAPEDCNGLDDDCNGVPDDGLPEGVACERHNEFGTCGGTRVCLGPKGWSCTALEPAAETCDGVDNDCDGQTDEEFKVGGQYALIEHCGACNKSCLGIFPHAEVGCDAASKAPRCVVLSCEPGYIKLNDYQCIPASSTICQPCVADADCLIPDARCVPLEDGNYCGQACSGPGDCPQGYDCKPVEGGADQCVPATGTCACTSETPGLSKACSVTWADPRNPSTPIYTCQGIQRCLADGWGPCELPVELCDGQDQNCNGLTDEGFVDPDSGKYTGDENCGICGNNCKAIPIAHGHGRCDASKTIPDCVVECNEGFFDVDSNPGNGCECQYLGATDFPGDSPPGCTVADCSDANCDGIDGEVTNGVFVAKYGSDSNPGTLEAPLWTIQAGIDRAASTGKRDVYVATGVYPDPVVLKPGVSVYGGYSADFRTREPVAYETVVIGGPPLPGKRAAVNAVGIVGQPAGSTTFAGFVIYAHNNRDPGGNSVGLFVKDCDQSLRLWDLRVVGGDGGNGLPGAPGAAGLDGSPGQPGLPAYDIGQNNCTAAKENPGGSGGAGTCGTVKTSGGAGGRAICPDYDEAGACNFNQTRKPAENGEPGQNNLPGYGSGGLAGLDAIINPACNVLGSCGLCTVPDASMIGADGLAGTPGTAGVAGLPCLASEGSVVGDEWVPGAGGNGGNGGHGGGGGGGGAAGGVETVGCAFLNSFYTDIGGSGGGGGAGGCGATGGLGGASGGGSFAIFMVFGSSPASLPILSDLVIEPGRGGNGGNGGNGGVGGKGGAGAARGPDAQGPTATFCTSSGGHGGNGGPGGHGGGGGGGCGGPAYGLFVHGAPQALLNGYKNAALTFIGTAKGGAGGFGGASLGNPGLPGQPGPSGPMNF